jgi:heat shock protein HslJ
MREQRNHTMNVIRIRCLAALGLLATAALVLAACGEPTPTPTVQEQVKEVQSAVALANTSWELDFIGEPADNIGVVEGTRPAVAYGPVRYGGSGGCNWFLGVYGIEGDQGDQLTMETPAISDVMCDNEEVVKQEATFISSLENTERYVMEGENLVLYAVGDQRMLTLKPSQPVPFEGTLWGLRGIGGDETIQPVLYETTPTAKFEGNEMTGNGGCNDFSAPITVDGDKLTIATVVSTREECTDPKGVMDQEQAIMSALPNVAEYALLGGMLVLVDDEGNILLVYGYGGE